jgi:hypothetical protein
MGFHNDPLANWLDVIIGESNVIGKRQLGWVRPSDFDRNSRFMILIRRILRVIRVSFDPLTGRKILEGKKADGRYFSAVRSVMLQRVGRASGKPRSHRPHM